MKPRNNLQNAITADSLADQKLRIERVNLADVNLPNRSLRRHSKKKLARLAANIEMFGFLVPIVMDGKGRVLAGQARVLAARDLGMEAVPAVRIDHLTEAQSRAFTIADNRLVELSDWDEEALRDEFRDILLLEPDFALEFTAFETAEIDRLLSFELVDEDGNPDDADQPLPEQAVSRVGNVWIIGDHRLVCGDCADRDVVDQATGGEDVDLIATDSPFNVPIGGHVRGAGAHSHREFVQASGEMSDDEFETFLKNTLGAAVDTLKDGGLTYAYMDWRSIETLLRVGRSLHLKLINLAVWNKTNGGMGSFYRSKHELCAIWKKGRAPHVNNVELGKTGRYRTNVWDYAGVNAFGHGRDEALKIHPTVKPVAMMMDIIKDSTRRGDLVFDPFAGSGTTLLAAQRTGRRGVGIELDPLYVDTIIARLRNRVGLEAVLAETGQSFDEVRRARELEADVAPKPDEPVDAHAAAKKSASYGEGVIAGYPDTYEVPIRRRRRPPQKESDQSTDQIQKSSNIKQAAEGAQS